MQKCQHRSYLLLHIYFLCTCTIHVHFSIPAYLGILYIAHVCTVGVIEIHVFQLTTTFIHGYVIIHVICHVQYKANTKEKCMQSAIIAIQLINNGSEAQWEVEVGWKWKLHLFAAQGVVVHVHVAQHVCTSLHSTK